MLDKIEKFEQERKEFLHFKDKIFMGERDDNFKEICSMLGDFDPNKQNPFDRERGCYLEDYSGVDKHLANVEKSL